MKIFVFLQLVAQTSERTLQRRRAALISLKMMSSFTTLKRNLTTSTYAATASSHAASCTNLVHVSPPQSAHFCCDRIRLYSAVPLGRQVLNCYSARHLPLDLDFSAGYASAATAPAATFADAAPATTSAARSHLLVCTSGHFH